MLCQCCGENEAVLECSECQDPESGEAKCMCEECYESDHNSSWRNQKHKVYYFAIKEQQMMMKEWPAEWKSKRQKFEKRMKEIDEAKGELKCRQGILEQQIKDEVTRLQQKLKQKGIEMIQKLKASTSEKFTWFTEFKDKYQECYDTIYQFEKEVHELMISNDVEAFPDKFEALQEKTQTISGDFPTFETECPKLDMMVNLDYTGVESEIERLYCDTEIIPSPLNLTENQSPVADSDTEVLVALQSNITGAGMFWVQPELSKDIYGQLLNISYLVRTAYMQNSDWKTFGEMKETPKVGDFCFARNPNDKKWYRSVVLEPSQRMPNETNVRFLDFGNQQVIKHESILPLNDDIPLPDLPYQAVECTIFAEEKSLKMDIRWAMADFVKSQRLQCKFLGKLDHDGRTVNHVDLSVLRPDGTTGSVHEFVEKKLEEASKGTSQHSFSSRDIRLLEDPNAFDKKEDKKGKKKAGKDNAKNKESLKHANGEVDVHDVAKIELPVEQDSRRNSDVPSTDITEAPPTEENSTEKSAQEVTQESSEKNEVSSEEAGTADVPEKAEDKPPPDEEEGAAQTEGPQGDKVGEQDANSVEGKEEIPEDTEQTTKVEEDEEIPKDAEKNKVGEDTSQPLAADDDEEFVDAEEGTDTAKKDVEEKGPDEVACDKQEEKAPSQEPDSANCDDAGRAKSEVEDGPESHDPDAREKQEETNEDEEAGKRFFDKDVVYKFPCPPTAPGEFVPLRVQNQLHQDGTFWAKIYKNDAQMEEFERFSDDLNKSGEYAKPCQNPRIGDLVLALFKKVWYRGRIETCLSGGKFKCRLIDSGMSAKVTSVKELPDSFISPSPQSLLCSIFTGDVHNFSREAIKQFADLVKDRTITAQILGKSEDKGITFTILTGYTDVDPLNISDIMHEDEKKRMSRKRVTPRSSPRQDARQQYTGSDPDLSPAGRGPPKILQPPIPVGSSPQVHHRQGRPVGQVLPQRGVPLVPDTGAQPQLPPFGPRCDTFGFKPIVAPVSPMPRSQYNDQASDWPTDDASDSSIPNSSYPEDVDHRSKDSRSQSYQRSENTSGDVRRDQSYNQRDNYDRRDQVNGDQYDGDRGSNDTGAADGYRDDGYRREGQDGNRRRESDGYRRRDEDGHRRRDDDGYRRRDEEGYRRRDDGYDGYRRQDGYGRRDDDRRGNNRRPKNDRRSSYGNSWGNKRRSGQGGGCYICGDPNHMKRDCPK